MRRGGGPQVRRHVRPGAVEQLVLAAGAGGEGLEQQPLALEAVRDVLVELRRGVPDVGPVARAEHLEVERAQRAQRVEVGGQRALAGRMKTLPSPEHGVAREADAGRAAGRRCRPSARAWRHAANGPACSPPAGRSTGTRRRPARPAARRPAAWSACPWVSTIPSMPSVGGRPSTAARWAASAGPGSTTQRPTT